MKITKYILCGGERLDLPPIHSAEISDDAIAKFKQFIPKFLAESCLENRECFIELPATSESRIFIKAFLEKSSGNRNLCWYLGIELDKQLYVSSYYSMIQGLRNITFDQMEQIRNHSVVEINTSYPPNFSPIGIPFSELCGNDFSGEYPNILNEFCKKISLNNINDWFSQLFIAVNPSKFSPEFSCMIGDHLPERPKFVQTPAPVPAAPSTTPPPSQNKKNNLKKNQISITTINFIVNIILLLIILIMFYNKPNNKIQIDGLTIENNRNQANIEKLENEIQNINNLLDGLTIENNRNQANIEKLENKIEKLEKRETPQKTTNADNK